MALTIASASLSDEQFLTAFAACTLPLSLFRHGDHLRLAWLCVHREPLEEAIASVRRGIRRFALSHGVPNLYHETLTRAWVTLIATHSESSFAEFIAKNEERLTPALLHRFWTAAALESEDARYRWLPPDRARLPDCTR